jgi:hypothetical protein
MYAVDYKLARTLLIYMVIQMQVYATGMSLRPWEMTRVIPANK